MEDAKGDKMRAIHPSTGVDAASGSGGRQQRGEMDRNNLMGRWIRQGKIRRQTLFREGTCSCANYLNSMELRWAWRTQHLVEFVGSRRLRVRGLWTVRSPIDHALLTECFAEARREIPVTNVVEAHDGFTAVLIGRHLAGRSRRHSAAHRRRISVRSCRR